MTMNCSDIKFPGDPEMIDRTSDGGIIARWPADPRSDYLLTRPWPNRNCFVLITRLNAIHIPTPKRAA